MWEGERKRCSSGGVSGDQEWDAHSRRSLVSLSSQMIHAIRVLFFVSSIFSMSPKGVRVSL